MSEWLTCGQEGHPHVTSSLLPHDLDLGGSRTQRGDGKFLCGFPPDKLTFPACCWKLLFKMLNEEVKPHKQIAAGPWAVLSGPLSPGDV